MRHVSGLDQEEGGSGDDEKWLDSVLILKVVLTGFSDGLGERMKEKEELGMIQHF